VTPSHPELQNCTGGTLELMKLIGINSRFALIDENTQGQKWLKIDIETWKNK